MTHNIKQPIDFSQAVENGHFKLEWDKRFGANSSIKLNTAQKFIDSEVIRRMVPYTPMKSGTLYRSPVLATVIGSGMIRQTAPYARYQYYGKLMVSSVTGSAYAKSGEKKVLTETDLSYSTAKHSKAGSFWFERMKAEHKDSILRGARKIAGAK